MYIEKPSIYIWFRNVKNVKYYTLWFKGDYYIQKFSETS